MRVLLPQDSSASGGAFLPVRTARVSAAVVRETARSGIRLELRGPGDAHAGVQTPRYRWRIRITLSVRLIAGVRKHSACRCLRVRHAECFRTPAWPRAPD